MNRPIIDSITLTSFTIYVVFVFSTHTIGPPTFVHFLRVDFISFRFMQITMASGGGGGGGGWNSS